MEMGLKHRAYQQILYETFINLAKILRITYDCGAEL